MSRCFRNLKVCFPLFIQVEKLIKELPTAPSDSSSAEVGSADKSYTGNDTSVESGTDVRETQSILLERIASEMNRLKFYISHAQVCANRDRWSACTTCFEYINSFLCCICAIELNH
jgi:hypothetical protein